MEGAETAAMGLAGTGITATHGLTTVITVITMYIIATAASTVLTIILDVGGFCPVGLGNETAGVLEEGVNKRSVKTHNPARLLPELDQLPQSPTKDTLRPPNPNC